jgi:hypothetical protein
MKLREGGPGDVAPAHLQQVDCTTQEQAQPSVAPPTPDADVDRGAISPDVLAAEVPRFQGLARMPSSAGLFRMPLILATVPRAPSARHWRTNWRSLRGLTTRCDEAYTVWRLERVDSTARLADGGALLAAAPRAIGMRAPWATLCERYQHQERRVDALQPYGAACLVRCSRRRSGGTRCLSREVPVQGKHPPHRPPAHAMARQTSMHALPQ